MTRISDIDITSPAGTDNISLGDDEIRQLKSDIKDSFPGFTSSATDEVTDASLGDATGAELAYAAKRYDSTRHALIDTHTTDIATNAANITTITGTKLKGITQIYYGIIDGDATTPSWTVQPDGFSATITRNAAGDYTVTAGSAFTNPVVYATGDREGTVSATRSVDIIQITGSPTTIRFEVYNTATGAGVDTARIHLMLIEHT